MLLSKNNLLQKNHFIIDIGKEIADFSMFVARNQLNGDGQTRYWKIFDENIKEFDYNKDNFKPVHHLTSPLQHSSIAQMHRRQKSRHDVEKKIHISCHKDRRYTHFQILPDSKELIVFT